MKRFWFILFCGLPIFALGQTTKIPLWQSKYDTAQLFWKDNINQSINFLKQAESIAFNDLGIYDDNYLAILNDLGLASGEIQDYKKAADYLQKCLSIRKELYKSEDVRVLESKSNLASIYLKAGDRKKARTLYYEIVLTSNDQHGGQWYFAAAENLASLYEGEEKFDSALLVINKALSFEFDEANTQEHYEIQIEKGRILRKTKKYDEAWSNLNTVRIALDSTNKNRSLASSVAVELSIIDIERGLYIVAEKELLHLYRTMKTDNDPDASLLTTVTNELGYIYDKIGVLDKALAYYNESLNRCVTSYGYNSLNCIVMQNNIAGIYLKQERIKDAIILYEQFIGVLKNISEKNNYTYLTALTNLASAYRQDGQYQKSLQALGDVYKNLQGRNDLQSDLAATVINNQAVTYTMMGDFDKATASFERVLTIKQVLYGSHSPMLLDVINNLAVSYWATKNFDKALPLFEQSLGLALREVKYIFPNLTEAEQVQFYRQQKQNFERFNTLAIQSMANKPELLIRMFNNQLLLKSLTFFTNKKRNALINLRNDKSLTDLSISLEAKSVQLGHCYQLSIGELKSLHISIDGLENEIDSLEKVVRHFLNSEVPENQNATWEDVRASLLPNEALVEVIRFRKYDMLSDHSGVLSKKVSIGFTDSVYYAALITTSETNKHPELVLLRNGNYLETRFFNYYKNTLRFDIDDTLAYAWYWAPLENKLSGKHKIYLSADGVFHQINLNAIHDHDGRYVLEKFDLSLLMNATQLVRRITPRKVDFSQIVLFGNPDFNTEQTTRVSEGMRQSVSYDALPGSLEEVRGIMNVLKVVPTRKNLFLQRAANEVNLRNVSSPSILHIATHGFFSSRKVYVNDQVRNDFLFHSGLVLSPTAMANSTDDVNFENDGVVTAYDVMNLDLTHTDLVVLSACETGLGKVEIGEGVYGLQRSFLQAGANDILVSLWKVEDGMTRDLMIKFYGYLSQQKSSREAFRSAQLDMLQKVGNPRLWAGFVMISGN